MFRLQDETLWDVRVTETVWPSKLTYPKDTVDDLVFFYAIVHHRVHVILVRFTVLVGSENCGDRFLVTN